MIAQTFTGDFYATYSIIDKDASKVEVIGPADRSMTKIVEIPSSVNYGNTTYKVVGIAKEAFMNCAVTSIDLSNASNLEYIGDWAFSGRGISTIKIPSRVNSIGEAVFYKCNSLKQIECLSNSHYSGYGSLSTKDGSTLICCPALVSTGTLNGKFSHIAPYACAYCEKLTQLNLQDNVLEIGKYAFQGCKNLTKANISNNVTTIQEYTFADCTNLQEISLPEQLTEIGASAFYNCSKLTEIEIPASVKKIDAGAFYLQKSIKCHATIPPEAPNAFTYCNGLTTIHVPIGTKELYEESPGWKKLVIEDDLPNPNAGAEEIYLEPTTEIKVYNLHGINIPITSRDELITLPAGIYIINGKKQLIP